MLSTLRFLFFTVFTLALIFLAVVMTIINTYKPAVRAYINGRFIGYFSNEQQFDEVYNDLVAEKQNIDPNVKVYLESEPVFETSYIRDSLLSEQNIYTNLRAEIKTEFTLYDVAVDGETKMKFTTQDEAENYVEKLKAEVDTLNTEVIIEKVAELGETTSIERADAILKDIVDRNKPVEIPEVEVQPVYTPVITTYTGPTYVVATDDGIWPTVYRRINCGYGEYYGHQGIDLGGSTGTDIYAYRTGTVVFAGWDATGYGNCIRINHGDGMTTLYAHCSALYVSAGDVVTQGQTIAAIGETGWATGPHLHFEIRLNGIAVIPYSYIINK